MRKTLILSLLVFLCFSRNLYAASADGKWNEAKGNNFIIYYKKAPQDFIKSVEEMSESYYHEIADNLGYAHYKGWSFNERASIYIYDDSKDYLSAAKEFEWSDGIATPQKRVIRTFPAAHGFFDSTLPHELGHIIFREFVGFKASVPLWFEEGVAMYQEKAKRFGAHDAVRAAVKNKTFIDLPKLSLVQLNNQSPMPLIELFYAESASVVYYMINELGQYRFVNFCNELQKGTPFETALEQVYIRFKNFDDLNKSWIDYLNQ